MVEENESTRGIACVARICCPVRMCQPIPASPRRRTDSAVKASAPSRATKIRSATEGIAMRTHIGVSLAAELLEPLGIALNLIEVRPETATSERAMSKKPRVVIVGAGFGGLNAAQALAKAPVQIT